MYSCGIVFILKFYLVLNSFIKDNSEFIGKIFEKLQSHKTQFYQKLFEILLSEHRERLKNEFVGLKKIEKLNENKYSSQIQIVIFQCLIMNVIV